MIEKKRKKQKKKDQRLYRLTMTSQCFERTDRIQGERVGMGVYTCTL